jgi:hypothetical protein
VPLIQTCVVEDPRYGVVFVHTDGERGAVEVTGDRLPAVVVRHSDVAEVSPYAPIGTRRAEHLTLSVAGTPGTLAPARGRFTRASHRVEATVRGARYRLRPSDAVSSRLTRDGRTLGELMLEPETIELMAAWSPDGDVQPQDVAVGYALATAFGTGAEHALVLLLNCLPGFG